MSAPQVRKDSQMRKNILFGSFLVLLMIISSVMVFSGDLSFTRTSRYPGGEWIVFSSTIDSAGIDTSANFNLRQYDHADWDTSPFWFESTLATSPTGGALSATVYIDGTYDGTNYDAVDTLYTTRTTTGRYVQSITMNDKKYDRYRMRVVNNDADGDTSLVFSCKMFLYQED